MRQETKRRRKRRPLHGHIEVKVLFKGFKKWIVRGLVYSVGLSLFLSMRWIDPSGDWVTNIISGFVLYMIAFIIPSLVVKD